MLSQTALLVATALAEKAKEGLRTTYENVAEQIGWSHPTGRGLGSYLYEIMHFCKERRLPPLTLIVVKKGTKNPSPDAMPHVISALGEINIQEKQKEVFKFDWTTVSEFTVQAAQLPDGRKIWLTSFWGFHPDSWGCIGFASKSKLDYFVGRTRPGVIVAIYVTKGKGLERERGKVVGYLEVSHLSGNAREFMSGDQWARKESDPESRGKWLYALKVTRAWRIVEEEQKAIDDLLPKTYKSAHPEFIGSQGVPILDGEEKNLLHLAVYEVPVYGQTEKIESVVQPFEEVLVPSRAIHPAKEPYWVGETDGPKHLYILRLRGELENYLGRTKADLDDKMIVKVGFSKSPMTRRDQIQAAYPAGTYKWEVLYPTEIPSDAPYPSAEVAIAGEDAMKARLTKEGAETLGREFYLADSGLVIRTWNVGKFTADEKLKMDSKT